MDIVSKIPIGLAALLAQAIAVDGGAQGPGVDLNQRIVLVNHTDFVAVILENIGKELGMHAGAERALKIVVVDDGDLGIGVTLYRTTLHVNLRHEVLGDINGFQMSQSLPVFG